MRPFVLLAIMLALATGGSVFARRLGGHAHTAGAVH